MKSKKDLLEHLKPVKINTPGSDFFETLASQIVEEHPKLKRKGKNNLRIMRMALVAAAVIVIAFVLMKSFANEPPQSTSPEKTLLSEIQDDEIYAYIKEHIDEFSIEEITEILTHDELDVLFESQSNELDLFLAEISDEEIINYIDRENLYLDEFEDELLIF